MQQVAVAIATTTSTATVSDIRHFYIELCRACGFRVSEATHQGEYFASATAHHPLFGNLRLEIGQNDIGLACSTSNSTTYGFCNFTENTWTVYPPVQINDSDKPTMDIILQACPEIQSYLTIGTIKHDPSMLLPKDEENRPDSPYMFGLIAKLIFLFSRPE